jgi:hypothetical protein
VARSAASIVACRVAGDALLSKDGIGRIGVGAEVTENELERG